MDTVMTRAYTKKEIEERMDENNFVKGNVPFTMNELIDADYEGFLDLAAERLVNSVMLMEIDTKVVGTVGETIIVEVSGDASEVIDDLEDDDVPQLYSELYNNF